MSDWYLDADWTPAELHERERTAQAYSRQCYELRRERGRRFGAFVQRVLLGSVLFFLWACVLALLLGAF